MVTKSTMGVKKLVSWSGGWLDALNLLKNIEKN